MKIDAPFLTQFALTVMFGILRYDILYIAAMKLVLELAEINFFESV